MRFSGGTTGDFLGCAHPDQTDELRRVIRWSDFYSQTELRNQPLYAEYFYPERKHGMYIGLPTLRGRTRRILFRRSSGRDFSDRDKLILQVLRPHLYDVYQDAQRRRQGIPRLTRREWQILELVAAGNSNADVARLLFISLVTVRKHMENIFDRTGSAVAAPLSH
jgi:DNA-binding CsgD family transcriptional regulator